MAERKVGDSLPPAVPLQIPLSGWDGRPVNPLACRTLESAGWHFSGVTLQAEGLSPDSPIYRVN
jgi:hypothetical protein